MPENYICIAGEQGDVYIAEEVLARIVGTAVSEVEGVESLSAGIPMEKGERVGKKSQIKGVRVGFSGDIVRIDAAIFVRYGQSVAAVGEAAQKTAAAAVESMTGLKSFVNVHVAGVAFDR